MHPPDPRAQALLRQRMLSRNQKRIRRLQNEIDFVEILVQFWPWPNMADRMERLQGRLQELNRQTRQLREVELAEVPPLPFRRRRFA
jgi:hypothetical protein